MPKTRTSRKRVRQSTETGSLSGFLYHHKGEIALAVLLAYSLWHAAAFYVGPAYFGDDTAYSGLAYQIITHQFMQTSDVFSLRLLFIYPVAFFYWIFGITPLSSVAWPIAAFLGCIAAVFYIGREMGGDAAGVMASLLLAFMPEMVKEASIMSTDVPLALFVSLIILGLLYGERRGSGRWYLLAGASIVAAPLASPLGLAVMPVVLLYVVMLLLANGRRQRGKLLYLLYGFAAALAVLMLFNYADCGNPLMTFTQNLSEFGYLKSSGFFPPSNNAPLFYPQQMLSYTMVSAMAASAAKGDLTGMPGSIAGTTSTSQNSYGFYMYAALASWVYLAVFRRKRAYLAVFWFAAGFLVLEFLPFRVSFSPFMYVLQNRWGRYLLFIAPAAALLVGCAVAEIWRRARRTVALCASLAVVAFLVATSLPISMVQHNMLAFERYDILSVSNYLRALPNSTVIYMPNRFDLLMVYMGYDNPSRFVSYDYIQNCTDMAAGSYIMLPAYDHIAGLDYTPDPGGYCPSWREVLTPEYPYAVYDPETNSLGRLYYVPLNGTQG